MTEASTLVLGPVGIVGAGADREISILRGNQAAIVALLAVRAPMVVSRAKIIDAVWGDQPPKTADAALRMDMSRVRRRYHELGYPDVIAAEGDGYRVALDQPVTDLALFGDSLARAQRAVDQSHPASALQSVRDALALWRGEPFANLAIAGDLVIDAAIALERRADAEELLVEVLLAVGDLGEAVSAALRNCDQSPYRERRWEQLMVAQARSGRPREALETFQRARRTFGDDLGLDPGPGLVELERRIVSNEAVDSFDRRWTRAISIEGTPGVVRPNRRMRPVAGAHAAALIGRDDERADLLAILERRRLVVVTGFGGIGKSALAESVAAGVAGASLFVSLAGLQWAERAVPAIAVGLGVSAAEGDDLLELVIAQLDDEIELLVLDSCEHLAAMLGPVVRRLLAEAPALRILATSRVELPLSGAITFGLGPLETGSVEEPGPAALIAADAALIRPSRLTDNWSFVEEICRRAGGVPLALELLGAASQDGVSPSEASTPGVTAAVHIAAAALPEASRHVVDALCSLPTEVGVEFLGRLLDQNDDTLRRAIGPAIRSGLVTEGTGRRGSERIRLLEPARDVLAGSTILTKDDLGIAGQVGTMAREAVPRFDDRLNLESVGHLDDEHETVIWALGEMAPARQIELVGRLGVVWSATGRVADGLQVFGALEPLLSEVPEPLVGPYLLGRIALQSSMASRVPFIEQLRSARSAAQRHGQVDVARRAGFELALGLGWAGRVVEAGQLIEELRLEVPNDQPWTALTFGSLEAMALALRGDVAVAIDDLRGLAEAFRSIKSERDVARTLFIAATLAEMIGDTDRLGAVLADTDDLAPGRFVDYSLSALAYMRARVARVDGNPRAGALLSEALALLDSFGEQRTHALCRREWGVWRLANGDLDGLSALAAAGRRLSRLEPKAAAVAVAHIVEHLRREGDVRLADQLAEFVAPLAAMSGGISLSPAETALVEENRKEPDRPADLAELRVMLRSLEPVTSGSQ